MCRMGRAKRNPSSILKLMRWVSAIASTHPTVVNKIRWQLFTQNASSSVLTCPWAGFVRLAVGSNKGIAAHFHAKGRYRAMAGDEFHIFAQGPEF